MWSEQIRTFWCWSESLIYPLIFCMFGPCCRHWVDVFKTLHAGWYHSQLLLWVRLHYPSRNGLPHLRLEQAPAGNLSFLFIASFIRQMLSFGKICDISLPISISKTNETSSEVDCTKNGTVSGICGQVWNHCLSGYNVHLLSWGVPNCCQVRINLPRYLDNVVCLLCWLMLTAGRWPGGKRGRPAIGTLEQHNLLCNENFLLVKQLPKPPLNQ